jgi:hypothetical protein
MCCCVVGVILPINDRYVTPPKTASITAQIHQDAASIFQQDCLGLLMAATRA